MSAPIGRLKKRPEFLKVASSGKKCVMPGLILQASKRQNAEAEDAPRLGLTASRKVGTAVARNRARRRLKAVAEKVLKKAMGGHDYVLVARKSTVDRPHSALVADLESALRRLDLLDSEYAKRASIDNDEKSDVK